MKMLRQDTKMKESQDFSLSSQQECFQRDKRTIRDMMQMRLFWVGFVHNRCRKRKIPDR